MAEQNNIGWVPPTDAIKVEDSIAVEETWVPPTDAIKVEDSITVDQVGKSEGVGTVEASTTPSNEQASLETPTIESKKQLTPQVKPGEKMVDISGSLYTFKEIENSDAYKKGKYKTVEDYVSKFGKNASYIESIDVETELPTIEEASTYKAKELAIGKEKNNEINSKLKSINESDPSVVKTFINKKVDDALIDFPYEYEYETIRSGGEPKTVPTKIPPTEEQLKEFLDESVYDLYTQYRKTGTIDKENMALASEMFPYEVDAAVKEVKGKTSEFYQANLDRSERKALNLFQSGGIDSDLQLQHQDGLRDEQEYYRLTGTKLYGEKELMGETYNPSPLTLYDLGLTDKLPTETKEKYIKATSVKIKNDFNELNQDAIDLNKSVEDYNIKYGSDLSRYNELVYNLNNFNENTGTVDSPDVSKNDDIDRFASLKNTIRQIEGNNNYNAYNGNPTNDKVIFTDMTIQQALDWQKNNGGKAIGVYQYKDESLLEALKGTGISKDVKFNEEVQEKLADWSIRVKRKGNKYLSGDITYNELAELLASEWAALPMISGDRKGKSRYGGSNESQITAETYEDIIKAIQVYKDVDQSYESMYEEYVQLQSSLSDSKAFELSDSFKSQADDIKQRSLQISEMAGSTNDLSAVVDATNKNYSSIDRALLQLEKSFLGSGAMLGAGALKISADVLNYVNDIGDNGRAPTGLTPKIDSLYSDAINYNEALATELSEDFVRDYTLDDVMSLDVTKANYLGQVLANNSPSIATVLSMPLIGGISGVSSFGVGTFGRMMAQRAFNNAGRNLATAAFFNMEAGGKLAELEMSQRNAKKLIPILKGSLVNATTPAERLELEKQINEQTNLLNAGMMRKGFSSLMYGGIASFAERFGSLSYVNNLKRFTTRGGGFLKKTLYGGAGISYDVGIEELEEIGTQIGHNFVDIALFDADKSMLDGIDKDFLANVFISSVAIQGPGRASNMYSMLRDEVMTLDEKKTIRDLRNELIKIEADIRGGKLSQEEIQDLKKRKVQIVRSAVMNDAITVSKINAIMAEDKITGNNDLKEILDLARKKRAKIREIQEQASTGDTSKSGIAYANKLQEEWNELNKLHNRFASKTMQKKIKQAEAMNTINPAESARAHSMFEYYSNLAASNVYVNKNKNNTRYDVLKLYKTTKNGMIEFLKEDESQAEILRWAEANDLSVGQTIDIVNQYNEGSNAVFDSNSNRIVVFEDNILKSIYSQGTNSLAARFAAVSPLHELLHAYNKSIKITDEGLLKNMDLAVQGLNDLIEQKKNNGEISEAEYKYFQARKALYDKTDVKNEELITLVNDLVATNVISSNEFTKLYQLKTAVNALNRSFIGEANDYNHIETGEDLFNYISTFQKVSKKQALSITGTPEEADEERLRRSRGDIRELPEEDKKELDETVKAAKKIYKEEKRQTRPIREAKAKIEALTANNVFEHANALYDLLGVDGATEIAYLWENEVSRRLATSDAFSGYRLNDQFEEKKPDIIQIALYGTERRPSDSVLGLIKGYDKESGVPLAAWINTYINRKINGIIREEFPDLSGKQIQITDNIERFNPAFRTDAEDTSFEEEDISPGAAPSKFIKEAKSLTLIDPIRILDTWDDDTKDKILSNIRERLAELDLKKLTFAELRDLDVNSTALMFGVKVNKITEKKDNLNSTEMFNAQKTFKEIGFQKILDLLPFATVPTPEGGSRRITKGIDTQAISDELIGTSTGLPYNMLKGLYDVRERVKTAAGIPEYTKKKGLSAKDIALYLGMKEDGTVVDNNQRGPVGQNIKGMMELVGRLITNRAVRVELQQSPQYMVYAANIAAGKSPLMASKSIDGKVAIANKKIAKSAGIKGFEKMSDYTLLNAIESKQDEMVKASIKTYDSKNLSKDFNLMLQHKTGMRFNKIISGDQASVLGNEKGRLDVWIPPSAEDFVGLLYKTLPKGKQGEEAMRFYKSNLFNQFNKGENAIDALTVQMSKDYKAIKKDMLIKPKYLSKKNKTGSTNEQSMRAWMFHKGGHKIPGFNDKDLADHLRVVNNDDSLRELAKAIMKITKSSTYTKPSQGWKNGSVHNDMYNYLRKEAREKYLKEWQVNADAIFSKDNMNKLQALYGKGYSIALQEMLKTMKEGRNNEFKNDEVNRLMDYINGSTAAIMFLNTRSALLQTISAINFINWSYNNPAMAAKAFANQKQYWKDFYYLFNSGYLVARRKGLKINVSEAEIAEAGQHPQDKFRSIMALMLKRGYAPTQFADSFAIASGGATFYRNLVDKLKKEVDAKGNKVYTTEQAEEIAFEEFRVISEDSQQSSRTDKVSMQQATGTGRLILAFANAPMQYARLSKKAFIDLKDGRGDTKTNISKIIYYTVVQNVIFNYVQSAMFRFLFGDSDDEEEEEKQYDMANSMLNSVLRGIGIYGAFAAMAKDVAFKWWKESHKKRPKYTNAIWEVSNIAPAIDSKVSKLRALASAAERGAFDDLDTGNWILPSAKVFTAVTNIPLDRAVSKFNNIEAAISAQHELWQSVFMLGGFEAWQLGIKSEENRSSSNSSGFDFEENEGYNEETGQPAKENIPGEYSYRKI